MTPEQLKEIRLELHMGLKSFGDEVKYSQARLDSIERLGRPIPKDLINNTKNYLQKKIKNLQKLVDKTFM